MGNFYVNYTLRGPSPEAVAGALSGRTSLVTSQQNNCVVAFDEASEDQNLEVIKKLAAHLSATLQCPLLAVLNHDDDVLWYQLVVNGRPEDQYESSPGYFGDTAAGSDPSGGDAGKLCSAFMASNVDTVAQVLRKPDSYTFAVEQHGDLVRALGLSGFAVGAGYRYATSERLPRALEDATLLRVT